MSNYIIIVAAGTGSRYGGEQPKQFQPLLGRPMLMTTIERMHQAAPDANIILVLSAAMEGFWREQCRQHNFGIPHKIVHGGETRTASVRNGLTLCEDQNGWTAIHDGARPCVTPSLMQRLVAELPAAIPVVPVTDSLRRVMPDGKNAPADRAQYRAVQTPQLFSTSLVTEAYRQDPGFAATDDATLVELVTGTPITLVKGDPRNIKVTNPGDMERVLQGVVKSE